jgi:hypothetical protein
MCSPVRTRSFTTILYFNGEAPTPSACPHDLHNLSTTRISSSLPNLGSSKSPTSSKNTSLSRLLGGSHVSAYCRSDDTESSNKTVVSGGIPPFVPPASWSSAWAGVESCWFLRVRGCVMRRPSIRRMVNHWHAAVRRRAPPRPPPTLVATAGGESPPKYPPITYTRDSAGATPTKANVKFGHLGPSIPEIADGIQIQSLERTASPCVRAGKLTPQPAEISRAHTILIEEYEIYPHG